MKTKHKPKHIKKKVKYCIQELDVADDRSNAEAFKDYSVDMISEMIDEITGENTTETHPPIEMKLKQRGKSEWNVLSVNNQRQFY